MAAQKKQKQWLAAQLQRQLGLDDVGTTAAGGEDDDAGAIGSVKQSRSSSVLSLNSDANGADAYNYYQSILHRKGILANAGPQQQTKVSKPHPATCRNMYIYRDAYMYGSLDRCKQARRPHTQNTTKR